MGLESERETNIIYGGVGNVTTQLRQSILQRNVGRVALPSPPQPLCLQEYLHATMFYYTFNIYEKVMSKLNYRGNPVVTHFSSKEPWFMFLPATSEKTERHEDK